MNYHVSDFQKRLSKVTLYDKLCEQRNLLEQKLSERWSTTLALCIILYYITLGCLSVYFSTVSKLYCSEECDVVDWLW